LKLGYSYFKFYLAKLGYSESDRCSYGGKETPPPKL